MPGGAAKNVPERRAKMRIENTGGTQEQKGAGFCQYIPEVVNHFSRTILKA